MSIHCKTCRRNQAPSDYEEGYKTCNSCRVKSKGKYKKHTIEECKKFAETKNGECLEEKYVNNRTKMLWKCSEGHEWRAIYSHIKTGHWCPECGSTRLNISICKKFAETKNGECLEEKYVNNRTKMLWRCSENHEWSADYNHIKRGCWCPECGGTKKLNISECKQTAEEKGGLCLSKEYVNARSKMLWKCSENHEWSARYGDIKTGKWCPECSASRSERLCREILEQHFNEQFPNVRPPFLDGLELDGYNEKLNIAFEYNGVQHYKYVPHFHRGGEDEFKQQLERDRKKYRICAEMGIKLILVPYKFDCYNPEKLKIFILDAIANLRDNSKIEHKIVAV